MTDPTEPSRWRHYLRFARPNVAADVDDELRFHIDMRAERNVALGMAPEDARRDALLRFGDVSLVRESLVDHDQRKQTATRRVEYLSDFIQDLRFGIRSLRRAPGFTLAATLTLALGIGANAAIFSFVQGVVLQPLPFARPHELVSIGMGSGGEFTALRDRLRSFAGIAAYVAQTHPIDDGNEAVRLEGAAVTTNLFPLLGVSPIVGRGFTADESTLGNNGVLLLSHGLWLRRFGGALDIVGKRVLVEGMPHTIVGVMPSDFHFPGKETQYWQPYAFNPANVGLTWAVGGKSFIGRLAPGVTFAQAQREVRDIWPTLRTANPLWDPGPEYRRNVAIAPLQDEMVGTAGRLLWILFACVFVVLLIGCVNVANLLLARATVRERELSVRAALGGGRGRLIRQLVTESVLLSAFGFTLGAFLAYFAVRWLVVAMPAGFPRAAEISVNGSVLAFTAAIALLTALLFGVAPAVRATSFTRSAVAAFGRRATLGISHARMSGALVAAQMALAVLLVIAAMLLVRSFSAMKGVEPGFQTTHVIAARITPPGGSYGDPARVSALYTTLVERLDAVPGVQSVAAVDKLPLAQTIWGVAARIEGQFEDASRLLPDIHHWQMVTPRYFETMGIPLLQGRRFADSDRADQAPVAIVSESFARRFWPDGNAIGRRIGYPYESPWLTIVGVVPDTKQDSLRDTTSMSMYVPWLQRSRMSGSEMWLLARSSGNPLAVAGTIRAIVAEVDRTVPVSDIRTMDAVVSDSVQKARFTTLLVGAFALAALLLGAIGIYGVMSYLVGQRSQEMGIRLALGAPAHSVLNLVVGRGVRVAAVGALVGVFAATIATRWLGSLLYGISATDPMTFVAVPLLFVVVASLASLLPALRATRVDPTRALRSE